jgi:ABC-type tungstate transport system substrate-binding protein
MHHPAQGPPLAGPESPRPEPSATKLKGHFQRLLTVVHEAKYVLSARSVLGYGKAAAVTRCVCVGAV